MPRAVAAMFLAAVVLAQPVPLPARPDGFRIGNGPVVIDEYLDLLCPDCMAAWCVPCDHCVP